MKCIVYDLNIFRRTGNKEKVVIRSLENKTGYSLRDDRIGRTFRFVVQNIEARYGSNLPKTGCVFKSPVSGMHLDAYGYGNCHNSLFQYMPKSREAWNRPMPMPADLKKVFKAIHKNKNRVMVLGNKSDPMMWMDHKYNVTKRILKFATRHNVTLIIKTMSDLCGHDDYIALIKKGGHTVDMNMSLNDGNEHIERLLSPGAPSLKRRSSAIAKLRAAGIDVTETTHKITENMRADYEKRTGTTVPKEQKQA